MRKGYVAELLAKKELVSFFGSQNVSKVAIGGACDFFVFLPDSGRLLKVVEVKECHGKKYYPSLREKVQTERIKKFCKEHNVGGELWIKYTRKPFQKKVIYSTTATAKGMKG